MELVLFIGIQASGKSSFYRDRFFDTHVRISLDQLRTRNRERRLLETCLELGQPLVLDNTNLGVSERARPISAAKQAGFRVDGYYFQSSLGASLQRNAERAGRARVPDLGIRSAHSRLQLPSLEEGFDALYYVRLVDGGGFEVEPWRPES